MIFKESYLILINNLNITYFQVTDALLQSGDCCYGSRWRN